MRRAIKRSMTVLKFARVKTGREPARDAPEGLHANRPYDVPDLRMYFKTRKYVTNLYFNGTEVTRSFAAFGGSCAPVDVNSNIPVTLRYDHSSGHGGNYWYDSTICNVSGVVKVLKLMLYLGSTKMIVPFPDVPATVQPL